MSVLNPRNRLVNFRLSEAEFEQLKAACHENGARSISEFARTAVLNSLRQQVVDDGPDVQRVTYLEDKVVALEVRTDQLLRLLTNTRNAPAEMPGRDVVFGGDRVR